MKTGYKYIAILLSVVILSCASGQLKTTNIEEDEAIIIARTSIISKGERINTKWNFLWDERLWAKNAVWVENDGYVFMKLPQGQHFISLLQYNEYRKNIPDNYLSVALEAGKIYYIGDLTFHWDISEKDVARTGVAGAIADAEKMGSGMQVDLVDNYEETVKVFNEKYGNVKPVEKQLIKIE